jgi:hypothetical protein
MIAILFIVLSVTNDSGEIMITGVLVFWGEAGDTRYASQSLIPVSPASPLHAQSTKSFSPTNCLFSRYVIKYNQVNDG